MTTQPFESLVLEREDQTESGVLPAVRALRLADGTTYTVDEVRRGGMGIVYVGSTTLPDAPMKRLAFKTFADADFFDLRTNQVMARELEIWTRLTGLPFVMPLLAVIEVDDKPYLAMPAAESMDGRGASLGDTIRQADGGAPLLVCFTAALCVALTMSLAQQRIPDVVHGDIKPDNVLFHGPILFLSDFGLAGLARERGMCGTPAYMAPELWTEAGRATPASDIYAYGAMLAELLTGRPPFRAARDDRGTLARLHATAAVQLIRVGEDGTTELATQLVALAKRCLAKNPEARPAGFAAIVEELMSIREPAATITTRMIFAGAHEMLAVAGEQQATLVKYRVDMLIAQDQYAAAIEVLGELDEEAITGELLLTAGSAWSLAGDDEKALGYLERFLLTEPAADRRTACLNEMGLSYQRLGRLEDAKQLFFRLITEAGGDVAQMTMVRGNYANVLLDLGEVDAAIAETLWIVRHAPHRHQGHAFLAKALQRAGHMEDALGAVQTAIQKAPRNGLYHEIRADILVSLRLLEDAEQAVYMAYNLGHYSLKWMELVLVTKIALGREDEVAALMSSGRTSLTPTVFEEVTQSVQRRLRALSGEEAAAASTDASAAPGRAPSAPGPRPSRRRRRPALPDRTTDAEAGRQDTGDARGPYVQLLVSSRDRSFAIDFCYDPAAPDYVEVFREAYYSARIQVETMIVQEREGQLRFTRCALCGVVMLTARDEGEWLSCQVCRRRSRVVTLREEALEQLARACEAAIGRDQVVVYDEATTLVIAFWLTDAQWEGVARRLREEGFQPANTAGTAGTWFMEEGHKRDPMIRRRPDQIWFRAMTAADEGVKGHTPRGVDRLIRELRREFGTISSFSVEAAGDMRHFWVGTEEDHLRMLESIIQEHPRSTEARLAYVRSSIWAGRVDDARRAAAALGLLAPDDPNTWISIAVIDLEDGRVQEAVERLERVVAADPRETHARALLVSVYQRLGDEAMASHHRRLFDALGGRITRFDSDVDE